MEKDQTIAFLKQQNAQYGREIDRKHEMAQFANSIIVAVQDFQQAQSRRSVNPTSYDTPTSDTHISDIRIGDVRVGDIRIESGDSNTIWDAISESIRVYSQI